MTFPAGPIPPDKSPDPTAASKAVEPTQKGPSPAPSGFDAYMRGAPTAQTPPSAPAPQGPSPMEAAKPAISPQTAGPTLDSILGQARIAQDSLGTVGTQLNTKNLQLKRAQQHLLRNKLQGANTYLRTAAAKLGIDTPPLKLSSGSAPLDRFLAYVNDGQDQMLAVQKKLKDISASGQSLRPADMLLVQVKMNQAQQEIEYSSVLLGKVIDAMKTMMNIQL